MPTKASSKKQHEAAHPAVVTRAANVAGAKRGKDSVPVQRDWTRFLTEQAEKEVGAIVGQLKLQGTRITCWIEVGEAAGQIGNIEEAKKKILEPYATLVYSNMVRKAFEQENMVEAYEAIAPEHRFTKKMWPEAIQKIYEKQIAPRVADTKRTMAALAGKYQDTMLVLKGGGTIQQKMLQMPTVSKAGRKKGSTNEQKDNGEKAKQEKTEMEKDASAKTQAENITSIVANAPVASIPNVLHALVSTGKRNKQYKDEKHFAILIDTVAAALAKYEAAVEAAGTAAEAKVQRSKAVNE